MKNPAPGSNRWTPSDEFLAQSTHLGWGVAFFVPALVLGLNPLFLAAGILVATAIKEFVFDVYILEGDSWEGSTMDFCFWQVGNGGGLLMCLAFLWGFGLAGGTILALFLIDLANNADWSLPYD